MKESLFPFAKIKQFISNKYGLIVFSIIAQQSIFLIQQNNTILLRHVSAWVGWAPVWMVWILYFIFPFIYIRTLNAKTLFASYSKAGWVFVFAAIGWTLAYNILSERDGVPVSWNQVEKFYKIGFEQYHKEQNQK